MENNTLEGKTYCLGYDERCNGCNNEHRWKTLIAYPAIVRIKLQKTMHQIDEGDCQSRNMIDKECMVHNKNLHKST